MLFNLVDFSKMGWTSDYRLIGYSFTWSGGWVFGGNSMKLLKI